MRLFWKILVGYWLAWALLSLGIFGGLSIIHRAEWLQHSKVSLTRPTSFTITNLSVNVQLGGKEFFQQFAATWPQRRGGTEPPFVVDDQGRELLGREVDAETLAQARAIADRGNERRPVKEVVGPDGVTYVMFYPEGRGPADRSYWRWIFDWPWAFALLLAVASLVFAGLLARSLARPIRALKSAFDAMAEGRLDARVGPEIGGRRDEIGDLGRHFDVMAARLAQSVGSQKQLLHDVSHELRSPLARLGVAVELARQRPDRVSEALARIEKENRRLDRLIGEVLTLARLEAGAAPSDDYVDLVELLRVVAEDADFEAQTIGLKISFELPTEADAAEVVIRGNAELLHRAIENVVRNALKHARGADHVDIGLELDRPGNRVLIRVHDHGEGVAPGELATLFDPFTRGGGSDGFGLGLSIARRTVEINGGTIQARNHPEGGLEVEIALPILVPDATPPV